MGIGLLRTWYVVKDEDGFSACYEESLTHSTIDSNTGYNTRYYTSSSCYEESDEGENFPFLAHGRSRHSPPAQTPLRAHIHTSERRIPLPIHSNLY